MYDLTDPLTAFDSAHGIMLNAKTIQAIMKAQIFILCESKSYQCYLLKKVSPLKCV